MARTAVAAPEQPERRNRLTILRDIHALAREMQRVTDTRRVVALSERMLALTEELRRWRP
jgi:hypothetical protein